MAPCEKLSVRGTLMESRGESEVVRLCAASGLRVGPGLVAELCPGLPGREEGRAEDFFLSVSAFSQLSSVQDHPYAKAPCFRWRTLNPFT